MTILLPVFLKLPTKKYIQKFFSTDNFPLVKRLIIKLEKIAAKIGMQSIARHQKEPFNKGAYKNL